MTKAAFDTSARTPADAFFSCVCSVDQYGRARACVYVMKRLILRGGLTLLLSNAALMFAQNAKDDIKKAGKDVKEAGKATGDAAKHTGKAAAKTAKTAGKKVKQGTNKAAAKVEEKTRDKK